MDAASIIKLMLIGGIMLNVISIGVRARPQDALALVREPMLGARAMLAMRLGQSSVRQPGALTCAARISISCSSMSDRTGS